MIKSDNPKESIVLVHGLMRSSKSMHHLGEYLRHNGYEIYLYNYPSTQYKIDEHGAQLKIFIDGILSETNNKKIHFITHSLGGIITREALGLLSKEQLKQCNSLIMLSPPNQGSPLAKLLIKYAPFITRFIHPLAELSCSHEAYVHQVAVPDGMMIGIIAGRFDAKTPPSVTTLNGQKDFLIINTTHTFIMNHPNTRKAIIKFLKYGNFSTLPKSSEESK